MTSFLSGWLNRLLTGASCSKGAPVNLSFAIYRFACRFNGIFGLVPEAIAFAFVAGLPRWLVCMPLLLSGWLPLFWAGVPA